jgi:hypothetical protein
VAAITTGFCHVLPLKDKTGGSINAVILFHALLNIPVQGIIVPGKLAGFYPCFLFLDKAEIHVHPALEGFM